MGVGVVGLQGLEGAAFDFKSAAFDLEADETFGEVGTRSLVHFLTVDENRDGIAVAYRREGIPFAESVHRDVAISSYSITVCTIEMIISKSSPIV